MRVLVTGRGVVGTIYGWALSKAGIDVTHVVRKEGLPDTYILVPTLRTQHLPRG
jgi:ketopantoate reductase